MTDLSSPELLKYVTLGASGALLPSKKSNFENTTTTSTTTLIILIVLLLLYMYCSLVSAYKLTNSWVQVILCFLFGFLYMSIAYMYYGLSGYKITK